MYNFKEGKKQKGGLGSELPIIYVNLNNFLASCSADMSIKIWDFVTTYECLKTLKG